MKAKILVGYYYYYYYYYYYFFFFKKAGTLEQHGSNGLASPADRQTVPPAVT